MEREREKTCKDCWHNYHCGWPQEGFVFNPDNCPYNPDLTGNHVTTNPIPDGFYSGTYTGKTWQDR